MSTTQHNRPWYCIDELVDEYKRAAEGGSDLRMRKVLTIIRSIIVNLGIIYIALEALKTGADATIVGTAAIMTLGLYNGIEIADYKALAQAIVELSQENHSTGDDAD